jgi:hypothetical protein
VAFATTWTDALLPVIIVRFTTLGSRIASTFRYAARESEPEDKARYCSHERQGKAATEYC